MAKIADKYFHSDPWKVCEVGFDPSYARVCESVFALANENMGVRGFFDEGGGDGLRGTYVNGVYEAASLPKSYRGIIDRSHFMIPAADWLVTEISLDGERLNLENVKYSDFARELDMRSGTLKRQFVWHTAAGKDLRLTFIRFASMQNSERAYQRVIFEALNFSGNISLKMGLSFDVVHEGRNACFWNFGKWEADAGSCLLISRTKTSGQEVFAAAQIEAPATFSSGLTNQTAMLEGLLFLPEKEAVKVDKKVIVLFDGTEGDVLLANGKKALAATEKVSFDEALQEQRAYWENHWRLSDVVIEPADAEGAAVVAGEQQGIRFCSFQMAQTYRGGSIHHNIGAKGLTGEAYNGHAFWDTEACCLPFFLFTNPAAAKSLLLFRYHTLPQAMERAKMLDCAGACYPIATLNGDEACDLWQHASLQFQPSTAVAYGIWHYVHVSGDKDFIGAYGAEMLVQIARFLASRADRNPHTGAYGYYCVMGPDEFHMMVNNNAYTNYMGKRSLAYAAQAVRGLADEKPEIFKRLSEKTGVTLAEASQWEEIAEKMAFHLTEEGLIEQHDGYFDLPHIDIHAIPVTEFPLYSHWSYDRIYRNDMIKQPDVLMFLYLYNSSFTEAVKRANYEFYEPRTIHESSLSPAIHSIFAAELGKMEAATDFFGYATRLDLDNYNRNTHEGLHTTSIAMAWINIVYGFAGLRSDGAVIRFAPRLPERWRSLTFSLTYQGRVLTLLMFSDQTQITLREGEPLALFVYEKDYVLDSGGLTIFLQS